MSPNASLLKNPKVKAALQSGLILAAVCCISMHSAFSGEKGKLPYPIELPNYCWWLVYRVVPYWRPISQRFKVSDDFVRSIVRPSADAAAYAAKLNSFYIPGARMHRGMTFEHHIDAERFVDMFQRVSFYGAATPESQWVAIRKQSQEYNQVLEDGLLFDKAIVSHSAVAGGYFTSFARSINYASTFMDRKWVQLIASNLRDYRMLTVTN